jgi:ubiquinone/menaquinone biosynthesis C-methylase UbiE
LPFPADSFDLVISTCTLPMISDDSRLNWLNELQRIVCPGGLVLLAIPGVAQATLQRSPSSWLESVHRAGILYTGTDPETNQPSARQEHAVSAFQSHDYVRTQWSGNFDVLDIIGAIANSQDLVIMRRR